MDPSMFSDSISIWYVSFTWCLTLATNFLESPLAGIVLPYNLIVDGLIVFDTEYPQMLGLLNTKLKTCQQDQDHIRAFDNWTV